jgi:hypothetical protein
MGGIVLGILAWQEGGESVGALPAIGAIALTELIQWLVRRERQQKPTLLDPDLFRSKIFRLGITGQMLQQIALGGAMIAIPIIPRAEAGWYLPCSADHRGIRIGLVVLVSQLNNYTLSPIFEE